jgi:hypothetical protein
MASTYYPAAYGGPNLDFSGITQAAGGIAGGLTNMWQNQAVSSAIDDAKKDDGTFDFEKAIMNLNRVGATKEANVLANYAESQEMAKYRNYAAQPEAKKLYDWAYGGGGGSSGQPLPGVPGVAPVSPDVGEPMRLGPDGNPTPQEFLKAQTATKDPYTIQSEKERAKYNAFVARKQAQAPNIKAGLRNLKNAADSVDDSTFANAVGPLQGADPGDIVTRELARGARFLGEVGHWWGGGTAQPPTEVRNSISGSAQALSASIKPLIRAPGEGIWTDKDQELLDRIVGNLAESRNKEEYYRRLQGVANRIQDNFGLDLSGWDAKDGSAAAPPVREGYASTAPAAPAYDAAEPGPVQGNIGGEPAVTGPGAVPPPPSPQALEGLKRAIQENPGREKEALEYFDRRYGRGQEGYGYFHLYGSPR